MKKKLISVYSVLLVIVLLIMAVIKIFLVSKETEIRDFEEIKEEGILRIAMEYNATSYFISGDSIDGVQYQLCKGIEKISGLKVEIYPEMNLAQSLTGLNDKKFDIVARYIPITTELKNSFSFSRPLIVNKLILVQRNSINKKDSSEIKNQLELAGKKVYVPQSSGAIFRIKNLETEIADSIKIIEDLNYGEEQLIIMVAKGEIDYAICNDFTAKKMKEIYPNINIDTEISFNQFRGWALRQQSIVLLDSINTWLDTIINSKQFKDTKSRYNLL
ncbi:MAG: transporter substrate-binding domain-containing protein [Bacteroidales bacterium]|nr:transporter substrate-binding domain-containing protein [Bacteroidales bacterium]